MSRSVHHVLAALAVLLASLTAAAGASAATRLMVVGDSITQGSSGDVTWRCRLATSLGSAATFVGDRDHLYDNLTSGQDLSNHTYGAACSQQQHHAWWGRQIHQELLTIGPAINSLGVGNKPQVMAVQLGTNDVYISTPAQAVADMKQLILNAQAAAPGLKVAVGRLYKTYNPFNDTYQYASYVDGYNAGLVEMARELNARPNLGTNVVIATSDAGFVAKTMTWDGTHPDTTGEIKIATGFAKALSALGLGTGYSGPSSAAWPVAGPAIALTPIAGDNKIRVSWSGRPPGAASVYVEQRNVTIGEGWQRLPVPLAAASGSWTAGALVPGHRYAYRLAPLKGLMVGQAGASKEAVSSGIAPAAPTGLRTTSRTMNEIGLDWNATANATSYYIEQGLGGATPQRLPYPISATAWKATLLAPGTAARFRIVPVNGGLIGTPSAWLSTATYGYAPSYLEARANGFYANPPQSSRKLLTNGGVVSSEPGQGAVQIQWFIPYRTISIGLGDDRKLAAQADGRLFDNSSDAQFKSDIWASRRVTLLWDTTTGTVNLIADRSCTQFGACFDASPWGTHTFAHLRATGDPDLNENRIAFEPVSNGIHLFMSAISGAVRAPSPGIFPSIDQEMTIRYDATNKKFHATQLVGNGYPAIESFFFPASAGHKPYIVVQRSVERGDLDGAFYPYALFDNLSWHGCSEVSAGHLNCVPYGGRGSIYETSWRVN